MCFKAIAVFLHLGITTVAAQTLPTVVTDLGLGYNVIYANTDGASWKSGGEDPGLLLTRHVLRMCMVFFVGQLMYLFPN